MPPKIVITGAECTGKTTYAKQLAIALNGIYVPEYARLFVEKKQRAVAAQDVFDIAAGQWRQQQHFHWAQRPVIFDTDLLNTLVYSEYYFGLSPKSIITRWELSRHHYRYILCENSIPWQEEAQQRSTQQAQQIMQTMLLSQFSNAGIDCL